MKPIRTRSEPTQSPLVRVRRWTCTCHPSMHGPRPQHADTRKSRRHSPTIKDRAAANTHKMRTCNQHSSRGRSDWSDQVSTDLCFITSDDSSSHVQKQAVWPTTRWRRKQPTHVGMQALINTNGANISPATHAPGPNLTVQNLIPPRYQTSARLAAYKFLTPRIIHLPRGPSPSGTQQHQITTFLDQVTSPPS